MDKNTVIGFTGSSGGSRIPHLHLEIRKNNSDETGLNETINPLDVLPKRDFEKLVEYKVEPYYKLWGKLSSIKPWDFSISDIPYSENEEYIK